MQNKPFFALFLIAVLVLLDLGYGIQTVAEANVVTYTRPAAPELTSEQQAWLGALEWCESGGNPAAINPRDSDGTPSYGLLQFKPGTYAEFAQLYGLGATTTYMNATVQAEIVTQMIRRGGTDWHHQFPGCTAKIGLPPQST